MQEAFFLIARAGHGDPRLKPAYFSLKGVIKKCTSAIVSGREYTHEKLIKGVAEQMGSAHEDEAVDPHLIKLSGAIINNQTLLEAILMCNADLVLEVGNSVLAAAKDINGFKRKSRPDIVIQNPPIRTNIDEESEHFEEKLAPLPPEGTVIFQVNHFHLDWRTNSNRYNFDVFKNGDLSISSVKHSDCSMEIEISGLSINTLKSRQKIPKCDQPGISIAITWKQGEVIIYLNGTCVEAMTYELES